MTMVDEFYNAKRDELEAAIARLARGQRSPVDLAEADDRALELLAGADDAALVAAGGDAARALAYVASLALALHEALRRQVAVTAALAAQIDDELDEDEEAEVAAFAEYLRLEAEDDGGTGR